MLRTAFIGARATQAQAAGEAYTQSLAAVAESLELATESANPTFLAAIGQERRAEIVEAVDAVMSAADALRRHVQKFGKFPDIQQ